MSKENTRNVIILKNLPSNLIAEAILVVKDKKQVADYMKLDRSLIHPATTEKMNESRKLQSVFILT